MTVDSGAFADGGQEQPALLPGELLDEEEDEQRPEIAKGMAPLWGSPAGKKYLAGMITRLLPPHKKYVEPFVGGGAVFWRKEPSEAEVLGDLDPDIAFSWKFARDCTDEQIAKLQDKNWTATRARFADLRKLEPRDDVERFYKIRAVRWMSFYNEGRTYNVMHDGRTFQLPTKLVRSRARLKGVKISHTSYEKLVREHDGPDTIFFFDPPYPSYVQSIVGKGDSFDGEKFAEVLRSIKGKFLATYGPKSDLAPFKGFTIRKVTTASGTPRGGVAQKVTVLIANYQLPKVIEKADIADGMMAALMLPPSAAKQLAAVKVPGTPEPEDNLHVTLSYFGKLSQSKPGDIELIRRALAAATAANPLIGGKISGFGRFRGGEKDALYASFDAPKLNTLRELITSACKDEQAPYAKEHGFTPHITLAFLDPDEQTPDLKLPELELRFDRVTLALGGEREEFLLGGALQAEPESLTTKELVAVHKYLHLVHESAEQQQDLSVDVHGHHAEVTAELRKRGAAPKPPADKLDVVSKQLEPWDDQGRRYAEVCSSGIELGPPIKLGDVLQKLTKPFQIANPGIWLVGGLPVHGETRGDIDILLNLPPDTSETTQHVIKFRLGRMLGANLAPRMQVHLNEYGGPFTDYVPLYNLEFNPCGERKRKEMRAAEPVERADGPLTSQAEASRSEDKVEPGRFFYMPKPTQAAAPEQPQSVENLVRLYKQRSEKWLPTIAQKKFDGFNSQIHKDGGKVSIISEDGGDNTDRFPRLVEAIKGLSPKQLVLAAEIERWNGAQHLPREAVAGYLSSKEPADDEAAGIVANVYDLLHDGEDLHNLPVEERLSRLTDVGLPQSTERRPNLEHRLNLVPSHRAETVEQLERVTRALRQLPGSEGAVFKQAGSPYRLDKTTRDDWVKFHNATTIRGVVAGADATNGSWTYTFGVLPGKSPSKTSDVEGHKLVIVGETFVSSRDFDTGDEILIETETVNLERGPQFTAMTAWVPRVLGTYTGEPDTVDQAAARARKNLVLQVKEIDDKGEVTYVQMSQVRKAKTTAALLVEAGPPNEWSGAVAGILGKEIRSKITRLWRALSAEDRKRTLVAFSKMFDAVDCIMMLEDRYGPIAKQRDPYLDIPPENGTYRYVVQFHFRGKSVHGDLRFQSGKKDLLGWTLDIQIAGAQKTEVLTLPEARSAVSGDKMGRLSKIDFSSGEWAERPRRGASQPVRTLIRAQRKKPEPAAWLNMEGISGQPEPGKPPAAGGTASYPGVFLIVDSGTVEYGAQKATTHEYFFYGKGLNYRVVFRLLRLERRLQKKLEPCMCTVCKTEPAVFDALRADCSAPSTAICYTCVDRWATDDRGSVIFKQRELPPSKPPEEAPFAEETWFAIRPDDLRPNVLQPDEVAKGWMPPLGVSALPKAVRSQVPAALRYWKAPTIEKARGLRDELVKSLSDAPVDFESPYKRTAKAAPRFVLQEQIWRGPIQVRLGPTKQIWWVRVDTGKGRALEIELRQNPLENSEISAAVGPASVSTLDARGDVPPGTALNPSKDTLSFIEQVDRGSAVVSEQTEDRIVLELAGSKLDGVFELQRRDKATWIWRRGKDTRKFIPVIKVNKKEGIVTGIVMEPDEVDGQNEKASAAVIRKAAHDFLVRWRQPGGTQLGDMHRKFGPVGFDLAEHWIERSDNRIGGKKVKKGTWLQTWRKTPDQLGDEAFRKFETGERTGFSIGGLAKVI